MYTMSLVWNRRKENDYRNFYIPHWTSNLTFDDFKTTNNFLWQDLIYLLEEIITANELLDLSRNIVSAFHLLEHKAMKNRADKINYFLLRCCFQFFFPFIQFLQHSHSTGRRWEGIICSRQIFPSYLVYLLIFLYILE